MVHLQGTLKGTDCLYVPFDLTAKADQKTSKIADLFIFEGV